MSRPFRFMGFDCCDFDFCASSWRIIKAPFVSKSVMSFFTDPSCDAAFQVNSTCYKVHKNERVSWFAALDRCRSYNASLAVFNDDVRLYFPSILLFERAWIGLFKSRWTWPGRLLKSDIFKASTYVTPKLWWLIMRRWGQPIERKEGWPILGLIYISRQELASKNSIVFHRCTEIKRRESNLMSNSIDCQWCD